VCHIERGVPCCLVSGGTVCPEDEGGNRGPPRCITIAHFDQRVVYGPVLPLNNTIGSRVVSQNADVTNAIPAGQPVQRCNICSPIIRHDLLDHTPPTQNLLENKSAKCLAGFSMKGAPFGPCSERTSCLYNVMKARGKGHEHCVDINLAEEWCW
jgi:hypothetical protein